MVQYAVTLRNGDWTIFKDGEAMAGGVSRSAAIEIAEALAHEAETRGESVELLVQGYHGELPRRHSGGD